MSIKISVVVPVYNVEKYLDDCLSSIARQTVKDIEVILVNDGSTDKSGEIMEEWCRKDSRFKRLDRCHSNGGACRNAGMALACGEYLAFLDSDDIFSTRLFEVLLSGIETYHADIACCHYQEFVDGAEVPVLDDIGDTRWTDCTPDCPERANVDSVGAITWDKLYRREYVQRSGLKYVEQPSTNDITFVWAAVSNANKVVATDKKLIAYRRHGASTQAHKAKNPECAILANREYVNELKRLGVMEKRPWVYVAYMQRKPYGFLIGYLPTLGTKEAYLAAYDMIKSFFIDFSVIDYCQDMPYCPAVNRMRSMLRDTFWERLRCRVESTLAPVYAKFPVSSGAQRFLIRSIRCLAMLVFDFREFANKCLSRFF